MIDNKEIISICGIVAEIIYTNEENGYTVCEIETKDDGIFTATGYLPYVSEGESIEVSGYWKNHPEYGEQFYVKSYHSLLPSDQNAILLYLSSGIIPGIRNATATKIVNLFGEETFSIMLNYPERLAEINGISKAKALKIGEEFKKLQSMSGIVMFLQSFNISAKVAANVHKILGDNAVEKIKENPYILADNIDGITFKTSDTIANTLGFIKNSPFRICSFAKHTLTKAAYSQGHTYLPKDILVEYTVKTLDISPDEVISALSAMTADKDIFIENINGIDVCYLLSILHSELYVARRIYSLSDNLPSVTMSETDAINEISNIEKEDGITLATEQREAVLNSILNSCCIITGGPGTGKTTAINTIIKLMKSLKLKIALAAPTGRAAKRMSEVTGVEAKTIHRLLCVVRNESELNLSFAKNEDDPLEEDVIIIDEMSMIDINLMSSLLKAIKPGARVIMVGDIDQLPSVGPGNVLNDLINSNIIPVVRLSHIFRQAQESLIVVNAHRINQGEIPVFESDEPDFFFLKRDSYPSVAEAICSLYINRLPNKYNIDPINSIQVLSPSRRGTLGINSLNEMIQKNINPPDYMKGEHAFANITFRVGDKVMQNKNNYDIPWYRDNGEEGMGIFNGDIGIIKKVSVVDKLMEIVFDEDKHVDYNFTNLDELELAYAITVHKSQGNEFPFVIIPVADFAPMLMFRNLLYTAITRAKQMVILVGNANSIMRMISNNDKVNRYSSLVDKINKIKDMYIEI